MKEPTPKTDQPFQKIQTASKLKKDIIIKHETIREKVTKVHNLCYSR